MAMSFQLFQLPLASSSSSSSSCTSYLCTQSISVVFRHRRYYHNNSSATAAEKAVTMATALGLHHRRRRRKRARCRGGPVLASSKEDTTELSVSSPDRDEQQQQEEDDPTPEDLECVRQIRRVLELLKKNRDMLFSEVKLTIMIEDPRELERRRLLGIDDPDTPSREDLAAALEEVNEGRVPEDRFALRILAEEMNNWPNLEVEIKKTKPSKSLYAKATNTGVDPQVAAKRLNMDWDSAAEIDDTEVSKESDVPAAVLMKDVEITTKDAEDMLASDASIPATNNNTKRADEFCKEVEDVYMTIKNFQQSELLVIENPDTLMKMESLEKEKQISVDPISLKESLISVVSPRLVLRPVVTNQKVASMHPPLPLVPAKPKFISASLPNSATSSPRFGSNLLKKKWKNQSPASPHQMDSPGRQHSPVYSLLGLRQESNLQRSKSCGEGRASSISDEFDLCLSKMNGTEHDHRHHDSFSKSAINKDGEKGINKMDHIPEEEFKCGALCLFLPAFGKGKPVRPQKEGVEVQTVISRTVSLERFECGSWSSSAIINDNEDDGDSVNLYFDLPLELIQTSVNDAHSPVTTAFVFDKDRKGVLKNGSARATASKSHESGRHVRFSTSSPASHPTSPTSCITPRLRKAREEFNAFLEAQSA